MFTINVLEFNTLYCFCFGLVVAIWEVRLKSGGTDVAVFRVLGTRRKSPSRTSSLLKSPEMVKQFIVNLTKNAPV